MGFAYHVLSFLTNFLHPRPQAEEAAAAAAAEEAAAAEARKQRQVEKKALQRERARLRRLCAGEGGGEGSSSGLPAGAVDSEDVEQLCSNLGLEGLQRLCDQLAAVDLDAEAKRAAVQQQLAAVGQQLQQEQAQKDAAAQVRVGKAAVQEPSALVQAACACSFLRAQPSAALRLLSRQRSNLGSALLPRLLRVLHMPLRRRCATRPSRSHA